MHRQLVVFASSMIATTAAVTTAQSQQVVSQAYDPQAVCATNRSADCLETETMWAQKVNGYVAAVPPAVRAYCATKSSKTNWALDVCLSDALKASSEYVALTFNGTELARFWSPSQCIEVLPDHAGSTCERQGPSGSSVIATAMQPATPPQPRLTLRTWPRDRHVIYANPPPEASYSDLMRRPEDYLDREVLFAGKIEQVVDSSGGDFTLRVNVTPDADQKFFTDTVLVFYSNPTDANLRMLEGDLVRFVGTFVGIRQYRTVLGANVRVPALKSNRADIFAKRPG
jgi:hypothetical protein